MCGGGGAYALVTAYPHLPEDRRAEAWQDLHRLTSDPDNGVRWGAARALSSAYAHLPEDQRAEAWQDLEKLDEDSDEGVRVFANHSLGRISILKATDANTEHDFKSKIEDALEFFDKSSSEASYFDPSKFCLPFYRSFYTITFRRVDAESEVQKYLTEAKKVSEGSKSKELLLEAVENLAKALEEAQNLRNQDLETKKCDLNACRRYCDRATNLLNDIEDEAPSATKLVRRGLPIIDHQIKEIVSEIEDKARALCKRTIDTPSEEIGREIFRLSQNLQVRDPIVFEKNVRTLEALLRSICIKLDEVGDPDALKLLEKAQKEEVLEDKLNL